MTEQEMKELKRLRRFYRRVAGLTLNHDVLEDAAVIYASNLGVALEGVNKDWWKDAPRRRRGGA